MNAEFHRYCGELLRLGVNLEGYLEFFLTRYFSPKDLSRKNILHDELLVPLGFERKTQIFRKICLAEQIDIIMMKECIDDLNYVKNIRNKVAHWDAYLDDPEKFSTKLGSRSYIKVNEVQIPLNDELVKNVNEKVSSVVQKIEEIFQIISDPSREKEVKHI